MERRRGVRDSEAMRIAMSAAIGAAVGLVTLFLRDLVALLHQLSFGLDHGDYLSEQSQLDPYRLALVPALGGLVLGLVTYALNRWRPTELIDPIEANALYGGQVSLRDSTRITGLTLVSNACGASVGMEAAYSQLGSGLFSTVGQYFLLRREDQRIMVTAGAAAAIGAAFNAPLAGAFYGFELIHGSYTSRLLAPVTAASLAGVMVVRLLGSGLPLFQVAGPFVIPNSFYLLFALMGVLAAGLGVLTMKGATWVEAALRKAKIASWLRPALGGLALSVIAIGSPQVLGSGHGAIEWHLERHWAALPLAALLIGKAIASSASLGAGFRGGLFSSSLFIGCLLGALMVQALAYFDPAYLEARTAFVLVGMGSVGAAIIGAPFTMVFLVLEATGDFVVTLGVLVGVVVASTVVRLTFGYSFSTWRFHLRGLPVKGGFDIGWSAEMTAARLMRTDARTIPLNLPLTDLKQNYPLGSAKWLFATDSHGRYAGIIDVAAAYDPELNDLTDSLLVADLATGQGSFLLPGDDIKMILNTFSGAQAETLPVLANRVDRQVIGSLSEAFCLRRYSQELEHRRRDELGMPQR
ncbi:chloride channel protein [bacterium]|nr:chloride channel protein [bacterium]